MAGKGGTKGKVIEFDPRRKSRLKMVKYEDPVQKERRKLRGKQRRNAQVRQKVVKNVGIFIGLCVVAYVIKNLM
ncbi:hypothetical protein Desca_2451 [Desulfotomaculum nigrificans CO-1-SRB]|uniref:Uncharacterized protein n=2 Tax=Desulfotomaculum nigrificans TaxID=1565 RepID=F6B4A2_DESCC|nr:hypothetical protein Desca_2451 [Desulfotomaculum nigrificans CO-1-SRB]